MDTYKNSDGCRDFGTLVKLTDEHKTDSAMLPADEEVAIIIGGHMIKPIFKFRTIKGHQYKVNINKELGVLTWQVLENNEKGYSPIPTKRVEYTMPWGNAGPFCDGNKIAKNVVADYDYASELKPEISEFSYDNVRLKGIDATSPSADKFKNDIAACNSDAQRHYLVHFKEREILIQAYGRPYDRYALVTERQWRVIDCMTGFLSGDTKGKRWVLAYPEGTNKDKIQYPFPK